MRKNAKSKKKKVYDNKGEQRCGNYGRVTVVMVVIVVPVVMMMMVV